MVYVPERAYTKKVLEAVEEGLLDRDLVIMACLKYMSESDVKDMCHANEFFDDEDDDDDYDDDDDDWMVPSELSHD